MIRTPAEAIELTKRLAGDHTNTQIAEQLERRRAAQAGTGGPFDGPSTCNGSAGATRFPIQPATRATASSPSAQVAERFGISDGTVYAWIEAGKLAARRGPANRLYIPFRRHVERQCRELVASSVHLPAETKIRAAGGAV